MKGSEDARWNIGMLSQCMESLLRICRNVKTYTTKGFNSFQLLLILERELRTTSMGCMGGCAIVLRPDPDVHRRCGRYYKVMGGLRCMIADIFYGLSGILYSLKLDVARYSSSQVELSNDIITFINNLNNMILLLLDNICKYAEKVKDWLFDVECCSCNE